MATFERHVDVDWLGGLQDGKGEAKAGSGAFTLPVTFPSRIGESAGRTSPEELMAAAHAACLALCGCGHVVSVSKSSRTVGALFRSTAYATGTNNRVDAVASTRPPMRWFHTVSQLDDKSRKMRRPRMTPASSSARWR